MDSFKLFCLLLICMVYGLANEQDKKTLVILDALKKYGAKKKPPNLGNEAKQYVSVTVLSQHEFADQSCLTNGQFPKQFSARLRVQYNEDNNKVHGEKIILKKYLDGLIKEMMKVCTTQKQTDCRVLVFLFSWYIPCSLNAHVCAKKLRESALSNGYQLFVGFSNVFANFRFHQSINNFRNSFETLNHKQIKVYYLVHYYSGSISKRSRFQTAIQKFSLNFQSNMYDCIIQTPVPFCCGSNYTKDNPESTDLSQIDKITALSINTMVKQCSESETFETSHKINSVWKDCFFKWTFRYIGIHRDCKKCFTEKKTYRYIVNVCINRAYETSLYIEESWYDNDLVWNKENRQSNDLPKCINKINLNPATFCTKNIITHVGKSSGGIKRQHSFEKINNGKNKRIEKPQRTTRIFF